MTRPPERELDLDADTARDGRLVRVEQTVRRALVARNGIDAGCEAAAEAMAWAVEHRSRLDEIEHLAGYLYRVGQSSLRRQRLWPRPVPVRFETAIDPELPFDHDLFDALTQLGHEQRVAVVMVHMYGHRYREVAELLEVTEAAVTNHVHRGLARLRTLLGDPA